jgi:hypothetical protein
MPQQLPVNRNTEFPYDPDTKRGDPQDPAQYIQRPGSGFFRPWISIPGGASFVWPLGVEGFSDAIEPTLGISNEIGGGTKIDVISRGSERISLNGSFPGKTSRDAFLALRNIVVTEPPESGYILYIPHLFHNTQRVFVASARFDHADGERSDDLTYSIDFIRIRAGSAVSDPKLSGRQTEVPAQGRGRAPNAFVSTMRVNTLRAIAKRVLKNQNRWGELYRKNENWFRERSVPMKNVPTYHLPEGTTIYY